MRIFNLTQHEATAEQIEAGVIDYSKAIEEQTAIEADCGDIDDFLTRYSMTVSEMLTFYGIPTYEDMLDRAIYLARLTKVLGFDTVMIGGAPFFMPVLQETLQDSRITVLYAFSQRVSVDVKQPDGSMVKTSQFKHVGFYQAAK